GLLLRGRPRQGHDHPWGRERVLHGDRERARRAPRDRRGLRDRRSRPGARRTGEGDRVSRGGLPPRHGRRAAPRGVAPGALQGPRDRRVQRAAPAAQPGRQAAQERVPRHRRGPVPDRGSRLARDVRRLDGRLALVRGAASGIGRASALAFARRGASLAICDLNEAGLAETEAEARRLGAEVLARRVDVARADEMAAFAGEVHARAPAVDLLMNNARVGRGGGLLDTTLDDWRWIVDINLFGVVHGIHCFVPKMVERRRGHVVNVASMAGYVASATLPAYTTTKYAVVGLSESLREELAPHGIGVTAVCPGIINTPIVRTSRWRGGAARRA